MSEQEFDYDQVVIGSGFGGSVSALCLSEKSDKTLVLERGKRWHDADFPQTNFNLKQFLWLPRLGLTGFWQLSPTRKLVALRAVGVGGGSLLYANTLYVPGAKIFSAPAWIGSRQDRYQVLLPFYCLAQRMMGVARSPFTGVANEALHQTAQEMGRESTFELVNAASFYSHQASHAEHVDPYFFGQDPIREACTMCAGCMTGCRFNARNTRDKNYLYFAQHNGVEIRPQTQVLAIEALPDEHGQHNGDAG